MTRGERGFLLLTSRLGIPDRKILTAPQLRRLSLAAEESRWQGADRDLEMDDLKALGIGGALADRILALLGQEDLLNYYLSRAARAGCVPLTRGSGSYPALLRRRLGQDSPGCLWAKGNLDLLNTPAVSLVGCRELGEKNRHFAEAVGRQAARQGLTLVSGNARGADRAAQEACLEAGGNVISIVADDLVSREENPHMLYLSEEGFDAPFSAHRALSRNKCIHALGLVVFVAQARLGTGGTWNGTAQNLQNLWSPVAVFRDGSGAAAALEQLGACGIREEDLKDFSGLFQPDISLF